MRRGATTRVLLVQDFAPWGLSTAAYLSEGFDVSVETVSSAALAAVELGAYDVLVTSGDQSGAYYRALADHAPEVDAFVRAGGRALYLLGLQRPADVILPRGAQTVFGLEDVNTVVDADHPLAAGVPGGTLAGSSASHASFVSFPEDGEVVSVDPFGAPTLGTYQVGSGTVVATGMPLEFYLASQEGSALATPFVTLFDNAVRYVVEGGRYRWLTVTPAEGTVGAGETTTLVVTLDAQGLAVGTYEAEVRLATNDPAQPVATVPVTLTVTVGTAGEDAAPTRLALASAGLNPTRGPVALRVDLPSTSAVRLDLFDVAGRHLASLLDGPLGGGRHVVHVESGLPAGVYLVRLSAGGEVQTLRVTVVR